MKIKFLIPSITLFLVFSACTMFRGLYKPSEFIFQYDGKYTGIDTLININGYYMSKKSFPSINNKFTYYNYYLFYTGGLVHFFNDTNPFESFNNKTIARGSWGNYIISGDTIKCQFVIDTGLMGDVSVDRMSLLIVNRNLIRKIDWDEREYEFHPLENRIDSTNWLLKKKWFYKKGCYPKK